MDSEIGLAQGILVGRHGGRRISNASIKAPAAPYWKWNLAEMIDRRKPRSWGFERDEVRDLLGEMLKQVRHVTGHLPDREMLIREGAMSEEEKHLL